MSVRRWLTPIALATAAGVGLGPAPAAAGPEYQADAAINVGYNRVSQSTVQAPLMPDSGDAPDDSSTRVFTEIRPGLTLQTGSPRLAWRFNYQTSVNLDLGGGSPAYSNQFNAAAITLPTKYTSLILTALAGQGGTSFLISQRPADTAQPELRAQGNPNIVSGTLTEAFSWDLGLLRVQQTLAGNLSAPQDDLNEANSSLNGTLALERVFRRYTAGLEVRSGVSRLQPQQGDGSPYLSITNAALARFSHDFTWKWSGLATAGVEQVFTDNGSEPVALLPTGSITANYTRGNTTAGIDLSHGSLTNIQVGTVSVSDRISGRGIFTLDARKLRILSISAGFLHNEPIGESAAMVAAGLGNVVQGDVGFSTKLTNNISANARYSVGYQFNQGAGLDPILSHIVFVGVTGQYGNIAAGSELPVRGRRVDGADGKGFPLGGDPIEGTGGLGAPGGGNLPLGGIPNGSAPSGGAPAGGGAPTRP
jgi:hypothetical protein